MVNTEEGSLTGYPWGGSSSKMDVIYGNAIVEDDFLFNLDTGTIVAYRGTSAGVVVPDTIGGTTVTTIGAGAFSGKTTIYEITIPDTVTSIESQAFSGCTSLLKVTIEGDTESDAISIGTQAFLNCSKMTELYIYGPVTDMASNALSGTSTLAVVHFKHMDTNSVSGYTTRWSSGYTAMTIAWKETIIQEGFIFDSDTLSVTGYTGSSTAPNMPQTYYDIYGDEYTVKHIAEGAFKSKTTFTSFNMPNTVETIGDNAFYGCTNLLAVVLSSSLTSIGASAFYNNTTLIGVSLPDSLVSIGENAFYNANKMTNVVFGANLETIAYRAFYACSSLEDIVLGDKVTYIGAQAFASCTALTYVTITGELGQNGIGSGAFTSCTKLAYIQLDENTSETVGLSPWGATNATILWKGYTLENNFVFDGVSQTLIAYIGSDMEVVIPESFMINGEEVEVLIIGDGAFKGNTKLMSLVIPDTVTSIGIGSFQSCTALAQVSFGNSIEFISESAFQSCTTLTKVSLPETVRIIGPLAFSSCTKVEEIIIPGDVEVISNTAFTSCSSLEIIYIPRHTSATLSGANWGAPSSTLTVVWSNLIYENGFIYDIATATITRYVGSSATINVPEYFEKDGEDYEPTYIAANVFQNKTFITKVIIPDTVEEIGAYAFSGCTKMVQLEIGDGVKYIGNYAFYNCTAMTTMSMGESVLEIGTYAFYNCTVLKELILPDSLEEIGAYSFYAAAAITELVIPDKVKTIGERAFISSTRLMDLTIGDSVTDIYAYAFSGCTKLSTITWGAKITNLWTYSFYNAQNLSELIIPETVNFIDSYAFAVGSGSTNILTEIEILGKISSIDVYAFRYRSNVDMIFLPACDENTVANYNWGLTNSSLLVLWSNIIYQDYFLFNSTTGEVVKYRGTNTVVTIPSVFSKEGEDFAPTSIAASAFAYNTVIQSVTVPATITVVGSQAFRSCTNLKEVIFIGKMETIGTNAFLTTSNLEVIYLPQNEEGSVTGSPWGGNTSITTILWSNYVLQNGFIFDISSSEVFKYIGSDTTVVVPSVFTKWVTQDDGELVEMTYKATKIADSAFASNTKFQYVTISSGITDIGYRSFYRNTSMAAMTFPDTLLTIGQEALYQCTSMTEAELPESLITIGNSAFYGCTKLALKTIGNNVKTIGTSAFRDCTALSELTIGDSVTTLSEYAFYNCDNLKTVTVGTGITVVGNYAFGHCAILDSVTFLGNVNTIGLYTFRYSYVLSTIYIPEKLENTVSGANWSNGNNSAIVIWKDIIYTGDYLFNTTTGTIVKYYGTQTTVEIPKTFTKEIDGEEYTYVTQAIGASAFYQNTVIQNVTVPDSVTDVGATAFRYCTNLKSITFTGEINTIGTNAFANTTNLAIISLQENEEGSVSGSPWGNSAGDVIWKNNIYASDFIYDIETKSVIKYIGSSADITVPAYFTKGETSYSTEKIGASIFLNKTFITKVSLPDTVTTIEYRAFRGCTYLTEVVLSSNLTTIGSEAFYNCQRMHTAKLPATIETIGTYAFYQCYVLSEVVIGDNLTEIQAYTYYGCYTISKLEMGSGVKTIAEYAFWNNNALTEITLGTGVTAITANAFNNCSNLAKVTIPSEINTIGTYAFRYCTNLAEIHIPQKDEGTVTGASWSASNAIVIWRDTILTDDYIYSISSKTITLYRGTATNVIVPSTFTKDGEEYEVEVIGSYAFASNSYIMSVTLPETLKSVDTYAFASSKSLSEIIFTSAIDSVAYRGFYNLSSIKVVVFPENYEGTVANQSNWSLSSNAVIVWKNLVYQDDFVYDYTSKTVTMYLGSNTTVVVPEIFEKDGNEYVPEILGASIFQNKSTITALTLPEGMITIEKSAVRNMSKLKTVILPSTLVNIAEYAFYNNTAMITCALPNSIKYIELSAFQNCSALTEITIPANVDYIGNEAFRGCTNALTITLKGKITNLGMHVFRDATRLNNLVIEDGVDLIASYMFYNCDALIKLTIPDSVTTIQSYAFGHCLVLSQISIGEGITSLDANTFSSSNVVTRIYIDQYKADSVVGSNATNVSNAWGANSTSSRPPVYWRGETVKFSHTITDISGSNNKTINVTAILEAVADAAASLESVVLPDGTVESATSGKWTGTWVVSQNGTYTFVGKQSNGIEVEYEVIVTNVGIPTITASNATIETDDIDSITVAKLVEITNAKVTNDAGVVLDSSLITIDQDDINEVKAMTAHNQTTMITLNYYYLEYNTVGTANVVITLVKGKQITIQDHSKVSQGAYWMEYGCTVEVFDRDGDQVDLITITSDMTTVTLAQPSPVDGYTFSYWNITQGADQNVTAKPVYAPDVKNITIKDHDSKDIGVYEICVDNKIYTYDKDGTVVNTHTVHYQDTSYTLSTPATVTGFDFTSWLLSKTSSGDVTATPVYTRQTYVVKVVDAEGVDVGTYSIAYESKVQVYNHTDAVADEYVITEATTITLGEASNKTGYTFVGWSGLKEASGNVAIKPTYTVNSYQITIKDALGAVVAQPTIEYDKKIIVVNESGTEVYSESVTADMEEVKLPSATEKEGYSYSYWTLSYQGDGSVILTPNYTINEYTITFLDEDGEEIRSQSHVYGDVLIPPTAPTVVGKTFAGWDPELPEKVPAKDATYTAAYTNNLYALTFWDDDGTVIGTSTLVEYDSIVTPPTNPTKTGYTFAGWSPTLEARMPAADTSYTATYQAGTGNTVTFVWANGNVHTTRVMTSGDVVEIRGSLGELLATYTITGDLEIELPSLYMEGHYVKDWKYMTDDGTLTVQPEFATNTYTITFKMPNGTVIQSLTGQEYGASLTAPTVPSLDGYTYANTWSPSVPSTVPAGNTTYTAVFTANNYNVTFLDRNGGTIQTTTVACGSSITVPTELIPTVDGYTFTGWSPSIPSAMPAYDVEFKAQYASGVFDKTIELYSHTGVYVGTVAVNVGDTISVKNHEGTVYYSIAITEFTGTRIDLDSPSVKTGYEFTEWGLTIDSSNHYTLTPNYGETTYTATFYDATGNVIGTPQVLKVGEVISVPADSQVPAVSGMTFAGWSPLVPSAMPSNNMNFTATFTDKDASRVTIYDNPGNLISDMTVENGTVIKVVNGDDTESYTINGTREIRLPAAVSIEGYEYDTWQVIDNGDNTYTVEALYSLGKYTMTFFANGSIHHQVTLQFGEKLTLPTDPISTTAGEMFSGWLPIVPATVPAEDMQFVATFTSDTGILVYIKDYENGDTLAQHVFQIGEKLEVYDENGNELVTRTVNAATETYILPEVPTKTGYTFTGWDIKTLSTGNVAASLTYTINKHTLTFLGEDGSVISSSELSYGATITEPTSVPTISGKTFSGWSPALGTVMPDNDVTYTATYIDGEFSIVKVYSYEGKLLETLTLKDGATVYFNNEYGNEMSTQTINGNTSINLPEVPTKEGYDVDDWIITVGSDGNATIQRNYSKQVYTIIFMDADGTLLSEETYEYGDTVVQPAYPSTDGVFGGWDPDFSATAVEDMTYYAQYVESGNAVTVNFYDSEGNFVGTKAVSTGNTIEIKDSMGGTYTTVFITNTSGSITVTLPEVDLSGLDNPDDYALSYWDLYQYEPGAEVLATAYIEEVGNMLTFLDTNGDVIQAGLRAPGRVIIPPDLSDIPVIAGKTFSGWTPTLAEIMPDIPMTYTATYVSGNYHVVTIKDASGATLGYVLLDNEEKVTVLDENGDDAKVYDITTDAVITLDPQEQKEGYSAEGFEITQTQDGGSVTIKPVYKILSYTLTFKDFDGSTISTDTVEYNTALTSYTPANPSLSGYTFMGWSPTVAENMPAKDTTYTATYIAGTYQVYEIYSSEGVLLETLAIEVGKTITVYGEDGSTLATHTAASVADGFGKIILPEAPQIGSLEFVKWDIEQATTGGNVTVTATYSGGPFKVTFYDEDEETVIEEATYAYGATMDIPTSPTKDGYTFAGWLNTYTNTILVLSDRTVPSHDTDFVATYEANKYTVYFEDEDGNPVGGDLATQLVGFEQTYQVPEVPAKTGYVFEKWVLKDSDPEVLIDMDNLVMPAGDLTYVLYYTEDSFTITYYADEEKTTVFAEYTEEFGAAMPSPSSEPTKEGYKFTGWSPVPESTVPGNDVEYTPVFVEGTGIVVTIYDHNNDIIGSGTIAVDGTITVKDDPEYTITVTDSTDDVVIKAPNVPDGYSYDGWIVEQDGADADMVITPQYKLNQYTISFEDADGNPIGGDLASQTLDYGSEYEVPTIPSKTGYTVDTWIIKGSNPEVAIDMNDLTVPANNVTYVTRYVAINYDVIFKDESGNTYSEDEYNLNLPYNSEITAPAGKEIVGYTFVGWEDDISKNVITTDTTPKVKVPSYNSSYTAKYEVKQYEMIFYSEEYVDGQDSYTVHETLYLDYESAMQIPSTNPSKSEYTFVGWTPDLPGTVPADTLEFWPTYVYGVGESIKVVDHNGAPVGTGYIMVEAGNQVIVKYDESGVNSQIDDIVYITILENHGEIKLSEPAMLEGYTFDGWEMSQDKTGENVTYTPKYSIQSYTMSFVDQDGKAYEEEGYTFTEDYGTEITAPSGVAIVGYDFVAWETTGSTLEPGDVISMPAKNTVYKAVYKIKNITITYYDEEGDVITDYSATADYNTIFVVAKGPDKTGYTFAGWKIVAPTEWDSDTLAQGGNILMAPALDVIFQAEYEINEYTVKFEDYNQSLISEEVLEYGETIYGPSNPSREGYTFTGWTPSTGGGTFEDGVTTVPASNITYVATYKVASFNIVYYSDEDGTTIHYSASVEYGTSVPVPNTDPIKAGWTFMGWAQTIPGTMPAENLEIYPIFIEGIQDVITITDHTGKLVQRVIVDSGNTITVKYSDSSTFMYNITTGYPDIQLDEPPTITGHEFSHWLLEQAADGENVVLTPQYVKEVYTIKFVNYNGELYGGELSVQVLEYGDTVQRPVDPTRSGYTFTGWAPVFSSTATGDVIYTATYAEGDGLSITIVDHNNEFVGTYAMEVGNKVDQYDNDGNIVATTVISDNTGSVKLNDPQIIDGYEFQRWEVTQSANGNIMVTPVFIGASKNIQIVDNDGKVIAEVVINVGNNVYQLNGEGEIIATIPIFSTTTQVKATSVDDKIGHTFTGEWNVVKDTDGNYTISPVYTINSYAVIFVDYDNWIMQEQTLDYNTSITAPADPVRAGYTFIGWTPSLSDKVLAADTIYKAVYEEEKDDDNTTGGGTTGDGTTGDGTTGGGTTGDGSNLGDSSYVGDNMTNNYYNNSTTGGYMSIPDSGTITIPDMVFNNDNNFDGGSMLGGDSYTDRTNNGFLNLPDNNLHLYHLVFMGSGLLAFALMFKKRRLDEEYGNEVFLKRIQNGV